MKIILILQDINGKITHHHPINEKELSHIEKKCTQLKRKIIYKLYVKTTFAIQRYEATDIEEKGEGKQ